MALVPLSANQLADTPTVFASFMGYVGRGYTTVGQLATIYRERSVGLQPIEDAAHDLRVERFAEDMAGSRWKDDIVIRIGEFDGTTLVIDGIHRGIAYLACIEKGVSPDQLPALCVDC